MTSRSRLVERKVLVIQGVMCGAIMLKQTRGGGSQEEKCGICLMMILGNFIGELNANI